MKKILLGISCVLSVVIALVLFGIGSHKAGQLETQQMAQRWSSEGGVAQISCFFAVDANVTEDTIFAFEHSLDAALQEASVLPESENPGARMWADAYSADGSVNLSSDRAKLEADAIGIGGDFFLFHPLQLISGSYFSGNDLMQDYCILDEDAAWQLFGSNDIAGQTVYIANVPHIVTGVIKREEGSMAEAAGLQETLVYVSYKSLSELGINNGINHYEIVMPNPVKDFALNIVKEKIKIIDKKMEVIENTTRYDFLARMNIIRNFTTRSMNGKAIIYPYWENIARGTEDIVALLTLFGMIFVLYPTVVVLVVIVRWWRGRTWTVKEVAVKVTEQTGDWFRRYRERKKKDEEEL